MKYKTRRKSKFYLIISTRVSNDPIILQLSSKNRRENIYLEIKRRSLTCNFIIFFFSGWTSWEGNFAAFDWPASRAANFNGLRPDVCSFSSPPACIYFLYINLNSYKSGDWLSISLITDKVVVVVVVVVETLFWRCWSN